MVKLSQIERFLEHKTIALAGASSNKQKTGHNLMLDLQKFGYKVLPINPKGGEILNEKVFTSVLELPAEVKALIIATKKEETEKILNQAVSKGITDIWIHLGAEPNLIDYEVMKQTNLIQKQCVLMFSNGKGIHGFHKFFAKLFKKYPK